MFLKDIKIIDITPQQLVLKVNHHQVFDKIFKFSKQRRVVQARQQYNLQSRDINKFIKQLRQYNAKMRQQKQNQILADKDKKSQKKYDQNQLKQLQFNQFDKTRVKTQPDDSLLIAKRKQKSIVSQPYRKSLVKKKSESWDSNSFIFNKQRKLSIISKNPQNLSNSIDSSLKLKLMSRPPNILIQKESTISSRKLTIPSIKSNRQQFTISKKKLQLYKKNLLQLLYEQYDQNHLPDDNLLNQKVMQRYKIFNIRASEYSEQKMFSLPLFDFSSIKTVDQSIRQFINMYPDKAQKIAFQIYDRNKNGVIDQKDLLQLIQLSEEIPLIYQDLILMIKSIKIDDQFLDKLKLKYLRDQDLLHIQSKSLEELSECLPSPISPLRRKLSIIQKKSKASKQSGGSSFRRNRFYTMLCSKTQFFKAKKSLSAQKANACIKWSDFKKIFNSEKPAIFYDLIKFIFDIQTSNFNCSTISQTKISSKTYSTQRTLKNKIQDIMEVVKSIQNQDIKVQIH